ncbi:MAG TPA: cytochrome c [Rhizomicrobium sp.]|jgi:mono/diheme cytochrome c family protein
MSPRRRIVAIVIGVIVLAALLVFARIAFGPGAMDFAKDTKVELASYAGANPTGVPKELAQASLVTRGEYLTRAADCEACHTATGGKPFAGGLPFKLPFGTLYSPNITPDPQTGIGQWSDAEFLKAIHQGVGRGGKPLYPALPYAAYTFLTDADGLAIKAYLFSLKPVHSVPPENTLSFPYNQRWLMTIWSALFNPDHRFQPNSAQTAEWNRGAYLVEGLAHCGECHTPRNLMQALNNRRKFAGAVASGWRAYNITPDRTSGVGAWSDEELAQFLSTGHAQGRGIASGPMGEAIDLSLRHLTPGDIKAIVTYLRTVPETATPDLPAPRATPAPEAPKQGVVANADPLGKHIFEGACASCHDWNGAGSLTPYATLTGNRTINDPKATNVAQMVIAGMERQTPHGPVFMPAFGKAYSDAEIAAVANYVTARFGAQASTLTAREVAELRRMN